MDLLDEIDKATNLRESYSELLHGDWPKESRFKSENVKGMTELFLNIYALDFYIKELSQLALRDDGMVIESGRKAQLEQTVEIANKNTTVVETMFAEIFDKIYK